jgi:hypothetical protein
LEKAVTDGLILWALSLGTFLLIHSLPYIEEKNEGQGAEQANGDQPDEAVDTARRSWGQASGVSQAGYNAGGYNNGYYHGVYNSSADTNLNASSSVGPTGDHSYIGCLGLSTYELEHEWKFSSSPVPCSYVHHGADSNTTVNASTSCQKSSWYSSCKINSSSTSNSSNSTQKQSWWSSFRNSTSNTANATNTTNATSDQSAATQENQGGSQSQDNNAGAENQNEGQVVTDKDAILTNEDYENVNGNGFVYNSTASSQGNPQQTQHWWSKGKTNATSSNSSVINTTDDSANGQYQAADVGGVDDDKQQQQQAYNGYYQASATAYDPYTDFNIQQCDTYQNLWLWDLSLTCKAQKSLEGCECSFAEELLYEGTLTCDDYVKCPADCKVCNTCFHLLGCVNAQHDRSVLNQGSKKGSSILIWSFALFVVGSVGYLWERRRRRARSDLEVNLISFGHGPSGSQEESVFDANNSLAWNLSQGFRLFDDYYGNDRQESGQSTHQPSHVGLNQNGSRAAADGETSSDSGRTDSGANSTIDNTDACSEMSETISDGSSIHSNNEPGGQRIWLAPVDVPFDYPKASC